MEIKQVWMSPQTARKSRYGWKMMAGVLGITLLAAALTVGGTLAALHTGRTDPLWTLALCLAVTALTVYLAVALGRRSAREATVFFLTGEGRLFVLDARMLVPQGRGLAGFAAGALGTQALLRELAARPSLPAAADEVLRVEHIRDNHTHQAVVCLLRRPNGGTVRRTCLVVNGIPDSDSLLWELERRQDWRGSLEPAPSRRPLWVLLSALACAGFGAVCALSHPAVGRLPGAVYFPCLGAAFAAFCVLVWQAVRCHRGE